MARCGRAEMAAAATRICLSEEFTGKNSGKDAGQCELSQRGDTRMQLSYDHAATTLSFLPPRL